MWEVLLKMKQEDKTIELYKIAIDTRNLEIKLFWQRNLFFAAFISFIFLGYEKLEDCSLKLMASNLGFLLSFAWVLVSRANKYWYETWETNIEDLEEKLNINLFKKQNKPQAKNKLKLYQGRRTYSISKLAMYTTDLIFISWVVILLKELCQYVGTNSTTEFEFIVSIIFLIIAGYILLYQTKTNISKSVKESWKNN